MTSDDSTTSPRGSVDGAGDSGALPGEDDLPKKRLEHEQNKQKHPVEATMASVVPDIGPKQQQQKAISFDEKSPMLIRKERSRKTSRPPMDRSRSHQETLTKDEARKRMLSWRKTTRPR